MVVAAAVVLLVVVAGVVAVRAFIGSAEAAQPVPTATARQRPGPVLLLPGYGGSTTSLERLAARLERRRDATCASSAPSGTEPATSPGRHARSRPRCAPCWPPAPVGGRRRLLRRRRRRPALGGPVRRGRRRRAGSSRSGRRTTGRSGGRWPRQLAPDECPTACQQLAPDSDLLRGLARGATPRPALGVRVDDTDDDVVDPAELGAGSRARVDVAAAGGVPGTTAS